MSSHSIHLIHQGFTLVELLVTISIIIILSTIAISIYSDVQTNARDAKRRGDLNAISKAFEANYQSGSSTPYQPLIGSQFSDGVRPQDPKSSSPYLYTFYNPSDSTTTTIPPGSIGFPAAAVSTYIVCARLENGNGNSADTAGTPATGSATHYCRRNHQ